MNVQVLAIVLTYALIVLIKFELAESFKRGLFSLHSRQSQRLEASKKSSMERVNQFMHLLEELKMKKSLGWYDSEALFFEPAPSGHFDLQKFLLMAMVHSMAGVITISDSSITPDEKHRLEDLAMEEVKAMLCASSFDDDVLSVLKEYVDNETPESRFVKKFDVNSHYPQLGAFEKSKFFDQSLSEQLDEYRKALAYQDHSPGALLSQLSISEELEKDDFLQ